MYKGVEEWQNDAEKEKLKYLKKNLYHYYFVHQNSHIELSGIEAVAVPWQAATN